MDHFLQTPSLKENVDIYNVVIGMYHDQVLTPIKTLFKFDAINITIGLPFIKYLQITDQIIKC